MTRTRIEVAAKVMKIVAEQLPLEEGKEITENSRLIEDLQADSLDSVEIVMEIDDALGIEIPDADVPKLKTVGEIINYVFEKLAAKGK